jgi:hypothetical protein
MMILFAYYMISLITPVDIGSWRIHSEPINYAVTPGTGRQRVGSCCLQVIDSGKNAQTVPEPNLTSPK